MSHFLLSISWLFNCNHETIFIIVKTDLFTICFGRRVDFEEGEARLLAWKYITLEMLRDSCVKIPTSRCEAWKCEWWVLKSSHWIMSLLLSCITPLACPDSHSIIPLGEPGSFTWQCIALCWRHRPLSSYPRLLWLYRDKADPLGFHMSATPV